MDVHNGMKILDIGSGKESVAKYILSNNDYDVDAEITRLDIDANVEPDIIHDIRNPLPEELWNKFDWVICSHVLEHIERDAVYRALENIVAAVKPEGELWVTVPSMDWVANEIRSGRPSRAWQAMVYGGQQNEYDYHKCGFTLPLLRDLMTHAGLIVRRAYQAPMQVMIGDQIYDTQQYVVVGVKYVGDPALAID